MNVSDITTLVVDFDRTVFDSDALYQDLYSLCAARAVPRGMLDYSLGLVPPNNLLFNFFQMVECSLAAHGLRFEKLIIELRDFVREEGSKYVFPDVHLFLDFAIESGCKIAILTHGDITFQLAKFDGSGLSASCHSFTATQDLKWQQREIFGSQALVFLDDNPKNIDGVKSRFPAVMVVEVKRPGTKYFNAHSSKADVVVDHLSWPLAP